VDEQIYPVEKSTAVEMVATLSAFQIRYLLRDSDPEAMFGAARGYLRTAESLDALADGIRRSSTDLAAGWRGTAAAESQQQLRQFYGSARSLAAAARASATALVHAAQALTAARQRVWMLPGGHFPSTDPNSMQSWSHQQVLVDLNADYRDAIAMAPTHLTVCLPDTDERPRYRISSEWNDRGLLHRPDVVTGSKSETGGGADRRPQHLSEMIPHNYDRDDVSVSPFERHGNGMSPGPISPQHNSGWDGGGFGTSDPYETGSQLAGASGAPGSSSLMGSEVPGLPRSLNREGGAVGGLFGGSSHPSLSHQSGAGAGMGGQQGMYPTSSGRREDERERERRYYLKEEREVWGEQFAPPAILYGEPPPTLEYDEDDDF
jgi:WXG100 family type VII secretion target